MSKNKDKKINGIKIKYFFKTIKLKRVSEVAFLNAINYLVFTRVIRTLLKICATLFYIVFIAN